jgi:hypothetical protein
MSLMMTRCYSTRRDGGTEGAMYHRVQQSLRPIHASRMLRAECTHGREGRRNKVQFCRAPVTHTHAAWTSERHLQRADRDDASWAHQDWSPLQRGWSRLPRAHASTRSAMVAMVAARASPARCASTQGAGAGTARRPRARTPLQGSEALSPVPCGVRAHANGGR